MQRLGRLVWKEIIELRQDPRLFGIVVLVPLIQLLALGYAATTDIRNVPVIVADADRTAGSRELIERFNRSPSFTVIGVVAALNDVDTYIERGTAWMALAIPSGYGNTVARGSGSSTLQIIADGSDANSTNIGLGYAMNLIAELAPVSTKAAGIEPRVRIWFNPQLESRDFMIPGILALLLLVVTTNLSSMAIVREKELGTLEQLNVTPLQRWELIVGKLLPYGAIGVVDVFLVVGVALWWFEIPLRGSFLLLLAMTIVYLITTLGLGLFVSTISSTQQQAMMTSMFFFLMPMMYLSGFIFPIENMPAAIQPLTYLIPLRYYLVILRSIFLKGVGLETLWPQALALAAWGAGILTLAVLRSAKRIA